MQNGKTSDLRMAALLAAFVLIFASTWLALAPCPTAKPCAPRVPVVPTAKQARSLILLIPDGCGAEQYTYARWLKGAPLHTDAILTGMVQTHVQDSLVADSASSASALAGGIRTRIPMLSLYPPSERSLSTLPKPDAAKSYRPFATLLEAARLDGKATGLISTSAVTHATPAAFMAHVSDRKQSDDILEQGVFQGIDVLLGGGFASLLPNGSEGGVREDGENLLAVLESRGVSVVRTREELAANTSAPVLGLFAPKHLAPELDRLTRKPAEPPLSVMTEKALEILGQDPDGFFLMVEGSQIDWACHEHDAAYLKGEMLEFDRAVGVALEYARVRPDTLVVVVSDHNCGGFSLVKNTGERGYDAMPVEALTNPAELLDATARLLASEYEAEPSTARVRDLVATYWGISLDDVEAARIHEKLQTAQYKNSVFSSEVLSKHLPVAWSTHGHTGGDVPLFATGPSAPAGMMSMDALGRHLAAALGVNLRAASERLFVDLTEEFGDSLVVHNPDAKNPLIEIGLPMTQTFGGESPGQGESIGRPSAVLLPVNRNVMRHAYLTLDGPETYEVFRETQLEGVVVYIKETGKVYGPRQIVALLRK